MSHGKHGKHGNHRCFILRILGFWDLRKPRKTLACAACSTSILYGIQANFCVSKLPQLFA